MIPRALGVVALTAVAYGLNFSACAESTRPAIVIVPQYYVVTVYAKGGIPIHGATVTIGETLIATTDTSGTVQVPWIDQSALVRVECPGFVGYLAWRDAGEFVVTLYPYARTDR